MFEDTDEGYRHEFKYVISLEEAYALTTRLCQALKFDKYSGPDGKYLISSVYFDSDDNVSLSSSVSGEEKRRKYRIRAYNHCDDYIKMEIKEKNRYLCKKSSLRITREIYNEIMYGNPGVLKTLEHPVADEFYYNITVNGFKPKTIVEYTRRAFVCDASNVRITLDMNIKGSGAGVDMFYDHGSLVSVFSPLAPVLEVKYDKFLPYHVATLLPREVNPRQSVSKYVFGRTFK